MVPTLVPGDVGPAVPTASLTEPSVLVLVVVSAVECTLPEAPWGSSFSMMRLWLVYTQMSPAIFMDLRTMSSAERSP
jgi:hypothetical protein